MKNYQLGCCLLLILGACHTNHAQKEKISAPDTLVYRYEHYLQTSKHIIDHDSTRDTTYYKAVYPVFEDPAINQLVSKQLRLNPQGDSSHLSIQKEAKNFIENFDDFIQADEYPRAWQADLSLKVLQNTPKYLSLSLDVFEFTGGAHGNYATLFFNYLPNSLDTLGLSYLIPAAKYPSLTHIAEQIFRKQEGLSPEQSLEENYFFEDNRFHLNNNFTLRPEGLLFLYNIYEIKPYVAGITELLIPYQAVDSLLTPEAKRICASLKDK